MSQNLSELTTLKIGGPAKKIIPVKTEAELLAAVTEAVSNKELILLFGSGSNLLISDQGSDSVVIKNEITGIEQSGTTHKVKSGTILQDLINYANEHGLAGLEKLAGIPGTVGGAVYGNAGAYGQSISDHLVNLRSYNRVNKEEKTLTREECLFGYRDSIFKHNKSNAYYFSDDFILEIEFQLTTGNSEELTKESAETIKKREVKYPPGIKCPGSFFKNIIADQLSHEILEKIPSDKIVYGKVPAGTLLEMVGAKGDSMGDIEIADYHANLFINKGEGTAKDFWELARKYSDLVFEKFHIRLEPEVQFINLQPLS
jgi:UDP-N-acetylmuramate dehydrogenase